MSSRVGDENPGDSGDAELAELWLLMRNQFERSWLTFSPIKAIV